MEYIIIKRVESNANDAAGRPKGKECGEGGGGEGRACFQYAEKFRNKISTNERHRLRFVNKQYEHY